MLIKIRDCIFLCEMVLNELSVQHEFRPERENKVGCFLLGKTDAFQRHNTYAYTKYIVK